ncbi:MAG: ABC transporter permease [Lachnospiraceae bacterium]|nr:ABC transporter permease [Lachnospiraceae bacterium]
MNHYTTHIKAKAGWFDMDFKELYQYKDLIWLFFKRNYSSFYRQTVLGPLWLICNPLISVILYAFVFGRLAGLSTEGVPTFVFYLCSNTLWAFFMTSVTQISKTFMDNANIFGKVYFPRLVIPLSSLMRGVLDLVIQLVMLVICIIAYAVKGLHFDIGFNILLAPVLILQTCILGLGVGIIIASLTTRFRDLIILTGFGMQLWMYATPVVYTLDIVPQKFMWIYVLNPMTPVIECFRNVMLGIDTVAWNYWWISMVATVVIMTIGLMLFGRIEKTFMDTI